MSQQGNTKPRRLPVFTPKPGVPESRAACKNGVRPCPYVRCKWHLWLVLGQDRQGRRWNGKTPPTTLRPAWLEHPTPPCCALDIADIAQAKGEWGPIKKLAAAVGLRSSHLHHVLATALAKLRATGFDLRTFAVNAEPAEPEETP